MSTTAATTASTDTTRVPSPEDLPNDVAILKAMLIEVIVALRQERGHSESLQHRLDGLLRRLYGARNERYDPKQPWLFAEMAAAAGQSPDAAALPTPPAEAPQKAEAKRRCRPHGRRRLPAHLPHEPRHHEL